MTDITPNSFALTREREGHGSFRSGETHAFFRHASFSQSFFSAMRFFAMRGWARFAARCATASFGSAGYAVEI